MNTYISRGDRNLSIYKRGKKKSSSDTPEIYNVRGVCEILNVGARRCFIHDMLGSFNNLDLIADKPPHRRFIGACKLFEGLPGEGSLSCVCVGCWFFFSPSLIAMPLNHTYFFLNCLPQRVEFIRSVEVRKNPAKAFLFFNRKVAKNKKIKNQGNFFCLLSETNVISAAQDTSDGQI